MLTYLEKQLLEKLDKYVILKFKNGSSYAGTVLDLTNDSVIMSFGRCEKRIFRLDLIQTIENSIF